MARPAHDSSVESHAGTTGSTNEAFYDMTLVVVGTLRALIVFTINSQTQPSDALSVKINPAGANIDVPAVVGGSAVDTAGEPSATKAWFLGSGIPAGNLVIRTNRNNNANVMYSVAAGDTATADCAISGTPVLLQEDGTLAEQNVDSGAADALRYAAGAWGASAVPGIGANSTGLQSIDFGLRTASFVRETTGGTGSRPVGYTDAGSDDRSFVHLAIAESGPPPTRPPQRVKPLTFFKLERRLG